MAQQGSPPSRSGRVPSSTRRRGAPAPGRYSWDTDESFGTDEQYPPWAGPGITPRWADQQERDRRRLGGPEGDGGFGRGRGTGGHRPRPGFRSRLAEARARRNRLMLFIWGGAAVAVAVIAAAVVMHLGGHKAAPVISDGLVTTFQRGELKTVPNACAALSAATLNQYLPGKRQSIQPRSLDGAAQSLCDWSVDAPPMYRQLSLSMQAYAPSGLAGGNGSATAAATGAYTAARQQKVSPPKATHMPKALVTTVPGLGGTAFAALQVVSAGGDTTDIMTVVAQVHNVLVTVILEGLARSHTGRYGPVSVTQLRVGAVAAAHDVLSHMR